jgi:hypothetical protein
MPYITWQLPGGWNNCAAMESEFCLPWPHHGVARWCTEEMTDTSEELETEISMKESKLRCVQMFSQRQKAPEWGRPIVYKRLCMKFNEGKREREKRVEVVFMGSHLGKNSPTSHGEAT